MYKFQKPWLWDGASWFWKGIYWFNVVAGILLVTYLFTRIVRNLPVFFWETL